ncbi:hypothetical protein Nocox_12405 [Nonomuraea coxensis DSM 45129]|uniref:Ig-like domain-containing protein n=1 Tax=Nonomuraea coxensis DSM 45129 TaxID=1122611 RepID=A0ABX8TXJ1_9ACTN|nr:hypothetical protein [Nonomuraea coxensis]QYC40099.1 hypothetical protein Nocox_12405 [Nonomuraea coxensis DSM 45129]
MSLSALVAVATLATAAALPLATAAALPLATAAALPPAAVPQDTLTCRVGTPPGRPVTFTPAVGFLPRQVTAEATLTLSGCAGTGQAAGLSSGRMTVTGTGRAFCTGVQDIRGKGRITWYDATGGPAGTSALRPAAEQAQTHNPGDMLLSGRIGKGVLAGARVSGTATPTSDVSGCVTRGLSSVQGAGTITFTT